MKNVPENPEKGSEAQKNNEHDFAAVRGSLYGVRGGGHEKHHCGHKRPELLF